MAVDFPSAVTVGMVVALQSETLKTSLTVSYLLQLSTHCLMLSNLSCVFKQQEKIKMLDLWLYIYIYIYMGARISPPPLVLARLVFFEEFHSCCWFCCTLESPSETLLEKYTEPFRKYAKEVLQTVFQEACNESSRSSSRDVL